MLKTVFFWFPRILSILFTAFISIFAFDVFGSPQWFLALLIHLIPTSILISITVIAWKKEIVGGFLFLLGGFLTLILTHYEAFVLTIPAFVIGLLFMIVGHFFKAKK
ncbi:hypothetical protein A2801_02585 [Candidatus Woesebacteria bacterium RIFCSPHIGHO2_01_FULL_41_10]|uniref:DUF7670 domain-containing protein n=1 Tax=Candidatus Woesebacteria bacterium RIFCSPHIGHO2_01_FULL_41_10 TaxID=1802500 RepID=A0A1F7YM33_9BACT|nr:MAG: hypothetical protein A2801_02585 [Candidatus Woesebacteria bacterium RIFCSPHIGHO2_01_FULL_41_10]